MSYKVSILKTGAFFNLSKYLDLLHNAEWEGKNKYFTCSPKFFQVFILYLPLLWIYFSYTCPARVEVSQRPSLRGVERPTAGRCHLHSRPASLTGNVCATVRFFARDSWQVFLLFF